MYSFALSVCRMHTFIVTRSSISFTICTTVDAAAASAFKYTWQALYSASVFLHFLLVRLYYIQLRAATANPICPGVAYVCDVPHILWHTPCMYGCI